MYVENANRATREGFITADNIEPNPKNPIIAAFFRNIGYADQLGSGAHNLFKYSKYYSGQEPEFIEGDVFKTIVPLNDEYSYDFVADKQEIKSADNNVRVPIRSADNKIMRKQQTKVLEYIKENGKITSHQAEILLQVKQRRARVILREMVEAGMQESM